MAGADHTRLCSIPGCGRRRKSLTYCTAHLNKWYRYGDPTYSILLPLPAACEVEGCAKKPLGRWQKQGAALCEAHYYRMKRRGTLSTLHDMAHYDLCQQCGGASNGRKFCCGACATRWSRAKIKAIDPIGQRARFSGQWHRRRARLVGAYVEKVDPLLVFERDHWRCHLCGGRISKKAKYPDPVCGSLDHVLPLAQGGAHSYANIKAAHLACNIRKGARPLGQMGLELTATTEEA